MATVARKLEALELPSPGSWAIDTAHSSVGFTVRHLMVSKVHGRFGTFSGTINVAERPEDSRVEVSIDASSIDTAEEKRDAHLRSPDFLDVTTHPTLEFRSTGFVRTSEAAFRLPGDLTIRGVTKPVTLDVSFEGIANDPWGNAKAVFSAAAEIDREAFGLTWNQALEAGGVLVGKQVRIELEVQASRVDG